MKFEDYKEWVMSRVNTENAKLCETFVNEKEPVGHNTRLALAAMGLAGETGEVVDLLKKVLFHGKPLDVALRDKLILEMGDVLWYYALLAYLIDVPLEEIMRRNVVKLMERDGKGGEKFHTART